MQSLSTTHLIRLNFDGRQIDLPAPTQELCGFLGCSPRKILLSDVEYIPLNAQGKELLIRLKPHDNLVVVNLAGTLLEVPDIKATMDEVVGSARNLLPEATQMQHILEHEKPDCPLIGQNGNVFNLVGIATQTLREHGLRDQAKEIRERVLGSNSYDDALGIMMEYVNMTSIDDDLDDNQNWDFEPPQAQGHGGMGGMC
ncbi:MAG: hypothetical protein FWD06_10705 [Oscillospiraceae bacterium]|nr:hypothetical protein [Oscillospiraceae bacterium]